MLDITPPDISGFVICMEREQYGNAVVIVMLTADNRTERVVTTLGLGADDFLPRPFDIDALIARIDIKLRHLSESPTEPEATSSQDWRHRQA